MMDVDVVTGCFMLVRKEVIDQVGVLDEGYFVYGEETDFCYRVKKAGWIVLFAPVAEIVHLGGASSRRVKAEMEWQVRASILLFVKKHKSWLEYVSCCVLTSLSCALRVPFWLVMAAFSPRIREAAISKVHIYAVGAFRALRGWRALSAKRPKAANVSG
jgi:GT2 family glycosyltransferase